MAELILETENRLGRETRPQAKNSSDMNPVMDEFAFLNFSVYNRQNRRGKNDGKFVLDGENLLKFTLDAKIETKSFALSPKEKTETRKAATFSG